MGGVAKSWALRKLPQAPGDKTLAIQQPDHETSYSTWSGTIEKGYGAGTVQLFRHGDAEVLYSRADQIRFVTHDGEPEEYTLVKTDGPNWLLLRNDPKAQGLEKPKYRSAKPQEIANAPKAFDALAAKLDGALAYGTFHKSVGGPVRLFSPRVSKRTGRQIEYTHKVPHLVKDLWGRDHGLDDTVVRGELLAVKGGKSQGHTTTSSILNTRNALEAREKQKTQGELRFFPFAVDRFKGQDTRGATFGQQLEMLQRVERATGWKSPKVAIKPAAKAKLFAQIQSGRHPMTDEGLVGWNLKTPGGGPTKVKFRPEAPEVEVRSIFGSKKPGFAGGFTYRGPQGAGRVGTGFTPRELKDMSQNPGDYVGRQAEVSYQRGGRRALRAPAFKRWHLG